MPIRTRLYYVAGAIVLTVALYLAPRDRSVKPEISSTIDGLFESVLENSKAGLPKAVTDSVLVLEKMLQSNPEDTSVMAELGRRWDRMGVWPVSAHYFEQVAKRSPGERQWLNAAYRYFDAFKASNDTSVAQIYAENAIRCYQEVLKLAPENLDAKTDLGVCYAESSPNPMQGIVMLREVVEKKPDHENAQ
ncbi:MAG: tetratricopeptide repeat protein [Bacteroidota bacterium]